MIGLIACCGKKLDHPAPARDLYTSTLFKKSRAWVESRCERWFVLSAHYGLVDPSTVIAPYNQTLKPLNNAVWGKWVYEQLCVLGLHKERFFVLAGRRYIAPLQDLIQVADVLRGMGIGERLAFLTPHAC